MKKILVAIFLILITLIIGLGIPLKTTENLNDNEVLRIHIRANSNSVIDQEIKYEVKNKIVDYLIKHELLTEEEITYFKRGRNSGHSKNRRSISVISYKKATGFEAMIGYLYLCLIVTV